MCQPATVVRHIREHVQRMLPAIVAATYDRAARATDAEIDQAAALLAMMTNVDLQETARLMGFGHLRLSAKAMAARLAGIIRDRRGIAQRSEY